MSVEVSEWTAVAIQKAYHEHVANRDCAEKEVRRVQQELEKAKSALATCQDAVQQLIEDAIRFGVELR